jgi:hypothetical protein
MDLNNNLRVDAEKRYSLLMRRSYWLFRYWQSRTSIRFGGDGMAKELAINPSIKARKALALKKETDKEAIRILKYLKQWQET